MAILKNILGESREYYLDLEKRLLARLKELPKGSVLKRRIGAHAYFYLKFRDGARVVSKYLGRVKPGAIADNIQERRLIKKQLKEVRSNLKMLDRIQRKKRRRGLVP